MTSAVSRDSAVTEGSASVKARRQQPVVLIGIGDVAREPARTDFRAPGIFGSAGHVAVDLGAGPGAQPMARVGRERSRPRPSIRALKSSGGSVARALGEEVVDRALGLLGLLLIALINWASTWGRPGRVIIGLVSAIGWVIDRFSLKARESGRNHGAGARERASRPA
jgi:hypothetical protein